MSTTTPAPTSQFVALTGLRGIAALVVVQWHGKIFLGGDILPVGYLAVDFFFLLSGWVLAHAYDQRLKAGLSAAGFMRLRLIRLYPVYLLALVVALTIGAINGHLSLASALIALVIFPDFTLPGLMWLVQPAWSLWAELVANLPFGLFHRRLTTRVLVAIVGIAFLGLVLTSLIYGSLDAGSWNGAFLPLFSRLFFSFFLGVLLYRHRQQVAKFAPRWSTWPGFAALLLLLAIPGFGRESTRDLLIVCLGLPAVLLFASNAAPSPWTARIAGALGAMSYPLYLIHVPLFDTVNILVLRPLTGGTLDSAPHSFVAGFMVGLVVLALLVDRFYDQPVRRWLSASRRPTLPLEPRPATR